MTQGLKIPVPFLGQEFESLADAASKYGLPHSTFRDFYHSGRLGELENRVKVRDGLSQGTLPLESQNIPADPDDTRLISFWGTRVISYQGIASVPSHVTPEQFETWYKEQGDTAGMDKIRSDWVWNTFEEISGKDVPDERMVVAYGSEEFPRSYDETSQPRGTVRQIGLEDVSLSLSPHWPVPDITIKAVIYEDQDGARFIKIDGRFHYIPEENRVVVRKAAA